MMNRRQTKGGLLNCGVTHKNPVGHMPLILVTLIPKTQPTMPHPLLRGNHSSVVNGELPQGNQLWLNGQDTCWDNGFGMLWNTLALSLGDKRVQYLLVLCP